MMSAHRTTHRTTNHRYSALAVLPLAFAAIAVSAAPTAAASVSPRDPGSMYRPATWLDDWPDEGTGYPGYGDQSSLTAYVPSTGSSGTQRSGLDTTSVALGALAGIALGGAGLGITLVVQRRRDHAALPTP
jgi:hypothetical protein